MLMQESTELKDMYTRLCEAQTKGDYSFFEKYFSRNDGVLAIGTDPTEWWAGYETITEVFTAQLKEVQGVQVLADTPLAYSDGSIGWVAGKPIIKLSDGAEIPARLTAVFQKETEGWKIVQWHFSLGIPNEDAIGETLTT
jgi:ketosteroid isomerase-like protein